MAENVKEKKQFKAKINAVLPGATIEKATTGELEEVKKEIDKFIQEKPQDKTVEKKVHAIRDELVAKAYGMSKSELTKLREEFKAIEAEQLNIGTKQAEQKQQMQNLRNDKKMVEISKEEGVSEIKTTALYTKKSLKSVVNIIAGAGLITTVASLFGGLGAGVVAGGVTGTALFAAAKGSLPGVGGYFMYSNLAKQGVKKTDIHSRKEEIFRARYNANLAVIMNKIKDIDKDLQKNMETYKAKAETMTEVEFRSYLIDELERILANHEIYLDKNTKAQGEGSLEPCAMGG